MVLGDVKFIPERRDCWFLMTSSVLNVICIEIRRKESMVFFFFMVSLAGYTEVGFCGFV